MSFFSRRFSAGLRNRSFAAGRTLVLWGQRYSNVSRREMQILHFKRKEIIFGAEPPPSPGRSGAAASRSQKRQRFQGMRPPIPPGPTSHRMSPRSGRPTLNGSGYRRASCRPRSPPFGTAGRRPPLVSFFRRGRESGRSFVRHPRKPAQTAKAPRDEGRSPGDLRNIFVLRVETVLFSLLRASLAKKTSIRPLFPFSSLSPLNRYARSQLKENIVLTNENAYGNTII